MQLRYAFSTWCNTCPTQAPLLLDRHEMAGLAFD